MAAPQPPEPESSDAKQSPLYDEPVTSGADEGPTEVALPMNRSRDFRETSGQDEDAIHKRRNGKTQDADGVTPTEAGDNNGEEHEKKPATGTTLTPCGLILAPA
jgi:hypothetical protein